MNRSSLYTFLNYLPIIVFALLGTFGPSIMDCTWTTGYFFAAPLAVLILIFLLLKGQRVRCFLIAAILYLILGTVFILIDFEPGYDFLFELMASGVFAVYFLVHLFQTIFPNVGKSFMEPVPKYPFIALCLYLGVVIVSYFLRHQAVWVMLLPFIVARLLVAYMDNRRSV